MSNSLVRNSKGGGVRIDVTPESADWRFLSFANVLLAAGESHADHRPDQETAVVPLAGSATVTAGEHTFEISRTSVFEEMPHIVYVVDAERLILYEVYVPRGMWSGWAPHRHDGVDGSPYLEETYYFRMDPGNGFAMHRNWAPEDGFDETVILHDGDTALVPKGFHSSVSCPSSNMFFLNYLAGELVDKDRSTPPCFDEGHTWIHDAWDNNDEGAWVQPVMQTPNLNNPGGMPPGLDDGSADPYRVSGTKPTEEQA